MRAPPSESPASPLSTWTRVRAREAGVPSTDAPRFVDVAVEAKGRSVMGMATAHDPLAFSEDDVVVLTHAGARAGSFLEERPIAASDAVLVHGRRPLPLDDAGWRALSETYRGARAQLAARGARSFCLSIDDGGLLAAALSPRTNPLADGETRIGRIVDVARALVELGPVAVALTVEERAPQGIDATLGIATARALAAVGVRHIVASRDAAGIVDEPVDLDTGDPAIASAAWLVGRVDVPVFAQLQTNDPGRAARRAAAAGASGLVVDRREAA